MKIQDLTYVMSNMTVKIKWLSAGVEQKRVVTFEDLLWSKDKEVLALNSLEVHSIKAVSKNYLTIQAGL